MCEQFKSPCVDCYVCEVLPDGFCRRGYKPRRVSREAVYTAARAAYRARLYKTGEALGELWQACRESEENDE